MTKINTVITIAGLCSLLSLYYGFNKLDNYENWLLFPILLVMAAFILAYVLFSILCKYVPEAKNYKDSAGTAVFAKLACLFSLLFIGIGVMINEHFPLYEEYKSVVIEKKFVSMNHNREDYYVVVNTEFGDVKLGLGRRFYLDHNIGQTVELDIVTGFFGFKYYKNHYSKK